MDWFKVNRTGKHYLLTPLMVSLLCLVSCGLTQQQHTAVDSSTVAVAETTPRLIEATLAGHIDDVRELLQQGTDPNLVHNTNTALTYAARDGFTEIASLLIDHGTDVNWIDGEGVTPLILASFKNHLDLVQLLLAHDADTTVRDQWNRTALDYALRRGAADPIAQLLREKS
ncbi:ankyrin repeat domain-containing protein [Leptolyngbya cf. ectocarpi LEGE 11479]|uniref:Ankyrin repeat domain-containing protein n=1 Tax=Leptolyngbya cf. ectocarpi LEGE 11479 TaxID=1828722 RepID=A0A928ZZR5_LEPEC|nr:ankyrin repeat domain-containing protein [Leptolyngbya ectocarpi]MBE9070485.1 ankyrin repeat domain-containing protein [Leptolyngbya cf. ectocarpi LEGE 11479]